ncbi:MAG: hypothetical protein IPK86_01210 [Neisseriales bacterium]|nr:MAG: hypothetical protein IPK86_01210 [Neisseriales bacterium]
MALFKTIIQIVYKSVYKFSKKVFSYSDKSTEEETLPPEERKDKADKDQPEEDKKE